MKRWVAVIVTCLLSTPSFASVSSEVAFNCEGKKILITHIAAKPPKYDARVRDLIKTHQPDILICGHSHFLKVQKDEVNNLLFLNPGAAGRHGFHKVKTLLRFDINQGVIENLEVVELGKRGSL